MRDRKRLNKEDEKGTKSLLDDEEVKAIAVSMKGSTGLLRAIIFSP